MPAWRMGQKINEWRQISGSSIQLAEPNPIPPGNTGPSSKIIAWCGLALDLRNGQVYSAANGGHGDYSGNEVDKLNLQADQPKWQEVSAPTPAKDILQSVEYYADGKPTSRHSYYSQIFIEQRNRVMNFGVGSKYGNGYAGTAVDGFNSLLNVWDPAGSFPSLPPSNKGYVIGEARAKDPATGNVYIFGDFSVIRWNQQQNNYSVVDSNSVTLGYYASAAFDTSRKRIFLRGGSNSGRGQYLIDTTTNKITKIEISGSRSLDVKSGDSEGLVYEPQLDAYLLQKGKAGGEIIKIDANSFVAEPLVATGGAGIPISANGVFSRFLYVPTLGGVFYYPTYSGNSWFLRTQ